MLWLTKLSIFMAVAVTGCDQVTSPRNQVSSSDGYTACLDNALQGSHSLSADEIRSLCDEIAGVATPRYEYVEDEMVPSNEFTSCYRDEKKALEDIGVEHSERLAKLSCKYPNIE